MKLSTHFLVVCGLCLVASSLAAGDQSADASGAVTEKSLSDETSAAGDELTLEDEEENAEDDEEDEDAADDLEAEAHGEAGKHGRFYHRAVNVTGLSMVQRGHRGEDAPSVLRLNVSHPNDGGCDTEDGCSFVVGMFVGGWNWKGNKTLPGDLKGLSTKKHRFNRAFLGGVSKGEVETRKVWRWEGRFWRRMVDVLVQDVEVEGERNWQLLRTSYEAQEKARLKAEDDKKWKKDWEVMREKRLKREEQRRLKKEAKRNATLEAELAAAEGAEGNATQQAEDAVAAAVASPSPAAQARELEAEVTADGEAGSPSSGPKKVKKVKKIKKRKRKKMPTPTPMPPPPPFEPIREYDEEGGVIVRPTHSIITITSSGSWIFDHTAVGKQVRINVAMWYGKGWAKEVPEGQSQEVIWSPSVYKMWRG